MSMRIDAYLKKEQIGTLFVLVGATEGGFRGGGRGVQPRNHTCLSKIVILAPPAQVHTYTCTLTNVGYFIHTTYKHSHHRT